MIITPESPEASRTKVFDRTTGELLGRIVAVDLETGKAKQLKVETVNGQVQIATVNGRPIAVDYPGLVRVEIMEASNA